MPSAIFPSPTMDYARARARLDAVRGLRLLVAGDLICDHYLWTRAERLSREAPVQVLRVESEEYRLGGAGNAAANARPFGAKVSLCAVTGRDAQAGIVDAVLRRQGMTPRALLRSSLRPTTLKTRVVAQRQQVVRLDREDDTPLSPAEEAALWKKMEAEIRRCDALLLSDYERGVLTAEILRKAIAAARKRGIPVVVDPKKKSFSFYRGATALTPNIDEAEKASGRSCRNLEGALAAARALRAQSGARSILVTMGGQGMLLLEGSRATHVPAAEREVFDVTGAGDTVAALFTCLLASGASALESAWLANAAAGLVVGRFGAATTSADELLAELAHGASGGKILTVEQAARKAAALRREGRKVVFTNGCFDLLHPGHVAYLREARSHGDALIVGLNSDASVRRLKGKGRPVRGESDRARMLESLDCVDAVVLFGEDTPLRLIRAIKPGVLVKGGDYRGKPEAVVGREEVKKWGGRVVLTRKYGTHSTTGLIRSITGGAS